jgi:large subunit ribosomal protein L9
MKVILKEDVKNIGSMGAVVNVADGYGRNYLIPKNLAVEANPKNIKRFEHEKNIILEKAGKIKNKQEDLSQKISRLSLTIEANAGKDGKLFGSVTSKDITEAVAKQGIDIDKRKIVLPEETIKRIGTYTIQVKLHPEVTASMQLEVRPVEKQEDSSG